MSIGLCALVAQQSAKAKRRFNLLMLEEREYYFEDYGGYMHVAEEGQEAVATPFTSLRRVKGRLHVCSKNLVFDPDDSSLPIVRLPFRDVASIKPRRAPTGADYFVVHTRGAVEIPPQASYVQRKLDLASPASEYVLSLSYVDPAQFLAFVGQLHAMYRLTGRSGPGSKEHALSELIRQREERIPFDSSALVDTRERALLPQGQALLAQQVLPALLCPGRFQLTDARVYFQQFISVSSEATLKLDVADVRRVYKRRFGMRDSALELFLAPGGGGSAGGRGREYASAYSSAPSSSAAAAAASPLSQPSVYFNFSSKGVRDSVFDLLVSSPRYAPAQAQSLTAMTAAWVKGDVSNFDYLIFVNQQAGRSFLDLTQYPVFPWVLSDYTSSKLDLTDPSIFRDLSKPIGALNPERLAMFQRRMRDMPVEISHGHPFLYGTHYSSPGYVLYWLVRRCPQYQLRLQNGKFDHADRLFSSVASSWSSVLQAPTDVKELIPEFYAAGADLGLTGSVGEFLTNGLELELGAKQSGGLVDDVQLPPWAAGSPARFVQQMRAALECEHVSRQLHRWIDLVFGFQQRGDEALKANNVFYWLTYEGAVDLEAVEDPQQRKSYMLQIAEFGQTPRQIFFRPHPQRFSEYDAAADDASSAHAPLQPAPASAATSVPAPLSSPTGSQLPSSFTLPSHIQHPELIRTQSHELAPISPAAHQPAQLHSPVFTPLPSGSSPPLSLPMGQSLSALPAPPLSRTAADLQQALEQGSQTLRLAAEVSEIETLQLSLSHDELRATAATPSAAPSSTRPAASARGSVSGSKAAWTSLSSSGWRVRETLSLHRDTVTSVQFAAGDTNLVSVSADSHVKIYSLAEQRLIRSAKVCDMTLSGCAVSADGRLVYASCWDNHAYVYNSVFGRVVSSVQAHDDAVSCLCVRAERLLTGSWDTTAKLFAIGEAGLDARPLHELAEHEAQITAVDMDAQANIAVTAAEDGGLMLWDLRMPDAHARHVEGFDGAVHSVCFSPHSSDFLASGSGLLRHIDAGTGRQLFQLDARAQLSSLRSDGFSCMAAADDGTVRAWNLRAAEEVIRLPTGLGAQAAAMAVNGEGTAICVASAKATLFQHESYVAPKAAAP